MSKNHIEEEPPSYDHAIQTTLDPSVVHAVGKYEDTTYDSYERGEMFIQAFRSAIDQQPPELAQQIQQFGFLNVVRLDEATHRNNLYRHPLDHPHNPAFRLNQFQVIFWPQWIAHADGLDHDVLIQATHPFIGQQPAYFEITVQGAHPNTVLSIGLTTKPYPLFRMPGWNKFSVGYHSDDGRKFCDDATGGQDFGPEWGKAGDVVGCGYEPTTGTVYFTLNGLQVGVAYSGLEQHVYYASVAADGPATVYVNFGQVPFRYSQTA